MTFDEFQLEIEQLDRQVAEVAAAFAQSTNDRVYQALAKALVRSRRALTDQLFKSFEKGEQTK